MRLLHLADIHIGANFPKNLNALSSRFDSERFEMLERILNFIKLNNIDIVMIAGDLFDSDSVSNILKYKIETFLKEILDMNIYVVYASGNHDYKVDSSYFPRIINNKKFIYFFNKKNEKKLISINNKEIVIQGIGYDEINPSENIYRYFEKKNVDDEKIYISIAHTDIKTNSDYYFITKNEIEALNFDYFALGHIHTPSKITEKAYFPGSFLPKYYEDNSGYGALIVDIDKITTCNIKRFTDFSIVNKFLEINASNYVEIFDKLSSSIQNDFSDKIDFNKIFYNIKVKLNINFSFTKDMKDKIIYELFDEDAKYQNIEYDINYYEKEDIELSKLLVDTIEKSFDEIFIELKNNESLAKYQDKIEIIKNIDNKKEDYLNFIIDFIKNGVV